MSEVLADPAVTRAKFEHQIRSFSELRTEHEKRGIFLTEVRFPNVFILFGVPQLRPSPLLFAAIVNFENFDLWAPSVKLVNPFTRSPYKHKDLPSQFVQRRADGFAPLFVASSSDEEPFFCVQGTREYHNNPGHTGNPWLLHRGSGVGTLFYIVDQLHKYGIAPLSGFDCQLNIKITGLTQNVPPE